MLVLTCSFSRLWPLPRLFPVSLHDPQISGSRTVTVTVSESLAPCRSVTVSLNVSVVGLSSAVKLGLATDVLLRATLGPAGCSHECLRLSPSGSLLPEPSRVTITPVFTVWFEPALAVGARFTTMSTVSMLETVPSETVS